LRTQPNSNQQFANFSNTKWKFSFIFVRASKISQLNYREQSLCCDACRRRRRRHSHDFVRKMKQQQFYDDDVMCGACKEFSK